MAYDGIFNIDKLGSNPQTFLVNIKSATADQVKEAVDFVRKRSCSMDIVMNV